MNDIRMKENEEDEPMRPMKTEMREVPSSLVLSTYRCLEGEGWSSEGDCEEDEIIPLRLEHVS